MGGHHDVIKELALAVSVGDDDTVSLSFDRSDCAAETDAILECRGQFVDIIPASTHDRPPYRAVMLQEAVIAEERHEIFGGKVHDLARWRRPDRSAHWREIVGQQARRKFAAPEIITETYAGEPAGAVIVDALAVEDHDIAKHRKIAWRKQVFRLGKQTRRRLPPILAAALPFKATGIGGDGEAHAALLGRNAQMRKQRGQIGVIQFVVDNEADIDRDRRALIVNLDGMAVTSRPQFPIKDRDMIPFRQDPRSGIAGNSRSNHRNAHSTPRSVEPL